MRSKWISRQNHFKLQKGVGGTFFDQQPRNLANLLLFCRFTNHITTTFGISQLFKSWKKCWSLHLKVFRASWATKFGALQISTLEMSICRKFWLLPNLQHFIFQHYRAHFPNNFVGYQIWSTLDFNTTEVILQKLSGVTKFWAVQTLILHIQRSFCRKF